ncbi:MAG: diacylglycerol kinase family protein [Caldilineales bacterium]|nr:diacylglycerol kinase family protein [Caldilineales bacterium]
MKNSIASFLHSFGFAGAGIRHLVRSQRNARIHIILTIVALGLAMWLGLTAAEWAALILTIGFVFAAEAMNTAIEALVDLISPQHHPLAKIAKDTAAAAVLLAAITAVLVAVILFAPRLIEILLA